MIPDHLLRQPRCPPIQSLSHRPLRAATDQAIAACGGSARDAVKSLIVAKEFLEAEVCDLMQAVSHAHVRGKFNTYSS